MTELTEETKLLISTIQHQKLVQSLLRNIAYKLLERADLHDLSKLGADEFTGFLAMGKKYPFGTPEYEQSLEAGKEAIRNHHLANRHHPEWHSNGVKDMSLTDILELVCDWWAANKQRDERSWEENMPDRVKRFNLTPEQIYLVNLIAQELE